MNGFLFNCKVITKVQIVLFCNEKMSYFSPYKGRDPVCLVCEFFLFTRNVYEPVTGKKDYLLLTLSTLYSLTIFTLFHHLLQCSSWAFNLRSGFEFNSRGTAHVVEDWILTFFSLDHLTIHWRWQSHLRYSDVNSL